jgi:transposase-like protein
LTKNPKVKGEAPMKMEITVPEVVDLIKQIRQQPEGLFEMIRTNVRETVGEYLSELMDVELTQFLGRKRYQRIQGETNHRNGSYPRGFTLKGIGEVAVKVPRDREGAFTTQVIPRSKQYEDQLRRDLGAADKAAIQRVEVPPCQLPVSGM